MSQDYTRCRFINEYNQQCETWFPVNGESRLCPIHIDGTALNTNKEILIDRINETRKFCHEMNLEELEDHIGRLEAILQAKKEEVYAARAVATEKLDKLSDLEREALRKIKVERAFRSETKEPRTSVKKDPVAHLTQKLGLSNDMAKDLTSMDNIDEWIAQMNAKKGKV